MLHSHFQSFFILNVKHMLNIKLRTFPYNHVYFCFKIYILTAKYQDSHSHFLTLFDTSERIKIFSCNPTFFRLAGCGLTEKSCEIMASMIQPENSLIELDMSNNDLGYSGVQYLTAGLSNHHCEL